MTALPAWKDPTNPISLGYDASTPAYAAAFSEADRLGALTEFQAELERVTADWLVWCAEYRRRGSGGVSVAGDVMDAWSPADPAKLLGRAILRKARREAYEASPEFQAKAYINAIANEADRACDWPTLNACDAAYDAFDRKDGSAASRMDALVDLTKGNARYQVLARAAAEVLKVAA